MCFESDAYPFCRDGASLVVRALQPGGSLEDACAMSWEEWSEAGEAREAVGVVAKPVENVAGSPIRSRVADFGGHRFVGMFPHPASMRMWPELNEAAPAH